MAYHDYYDDPQNAPVIGGTRHRVTYAAHPAHDPRMAPAAYPAYASDPYGDANDLAEPGAGDNAPRLGAAVSVAGALVSIGLVVGMGLWAWQLAVRDVSGVPVIRALEGPMRVAPAEPGGAQAEHQGLAVNRIAEGAQAAPVPDRLVLAPPPVDLADIEIAPPSATDETGETSVQTRALIDRLLAEAGEEVAPDTVPAAPGAAAIVPASVPGVARSVRPVLRPASLETVSSSLGSAATDPAPQGRELALADLPAGTRLVQLGAFDTPDLARAEWQRLAGVFPDFFADRARVIQQASSGGQDFYRLRAHGFDDLAASRRFCSALVAQGAVCIPVSVR